MEAREAKATHGSIVVPTRLLGQLGQRAAHAHLEVEKHKTNAAMRRAAQQAEDRRAPPGYRTITVLSENVAGRSLRVKLFGGHEEEWYAREIGCRWLALHGDMRQRLAEEARVIGQLNHQNVVRFEGLVWSEDRNTVFLLSHYCAGGSLLDKFNAVRERACKEHSKDTGMPDAFVRACMQAVLDAVEHIHVEVGVAHTNVKMESVLFDLGGRVRLGAPVPLVAATALQDLKEHLRGASANLLSPDPHAHHHVHAAQHHPRFSRPQPKTEQQRQDEIHHATTLAKANDVQHAGEMLLELCTLKTIAEHGGTQNAMIDATARLKESFVIHAWPMVKDVAVNRISASQAAWRFAQNPDDLKLRDSRFDSWRVNTRDRRLLRDNYEASQVETPEERLKRLRMHTRSLARKLFDASDFQGHLRICLQHILTDTGCGCVIGDAAFVTALVSSDGLAAEKLLKLAQRCNWKDPLTICRRAVVTWLFGNDHDEVVENWQLALQLGEEEDIVRCWVAEALCEAGNVLHARVLIQDMLGADDKNFGHKRCKVPAQVLASLATWEKARGEVDKAIATAAVALEFTQNNELSLDLFEGWIQDLRTVRFGSQLEKMSTATETRQAGGEEHVLQERMEAESLRDTDDKGGTVLVPCDEAAIEAYRVYADHMRKPHSLNLLQCMSTVDAVSRTSLVRAQAHTVYARLVAENGQYIAAEFHYLMALAAMQSAVEAGNPLVLLARQELGDLYVSQVGRKDSQKVDAALQSAAVEIYESILVDGEREKNEHNPIVDALALLKVGGKHLDSADAHVSPRTTQFAYPARSPTLPSVVTWLLPTVVEVVATNEVGGDGDINDAVEGVTARDQGKRVRNLCKVVRGRLLRLLVSAGEYTTAAGVCQSIVEEEEARFESLRKSGEQGDAALLASWYGWLSEICSEAGDFRTAMRAQQKGIHLRSLEKAQQRRAVT